MAKRCLLILQGQIHRNDEVDIGFIPCVYGTAGNMKGKKLIRRQFQFLKNEKAERGFCKVERDGEIC